MRKWIVLGLMVLSARASFAQSLNVDLTGQWGQGRCEAIHRRGEYTFVGNGPSIEAYRNKRGVYAKSDAILLPGLVKDVWVRGDLSVVYIACNQAGLRIVQFDALNGLFLGEVGKDTTIGPASGVMQFGNTAYVADGKGLAIFDIADPYNPTLKSTFATAGFAHDVWALNDSTVFVAADSAGLYAIRTKNLLTPTFLDSIKFAPAFPGFSVPAPRTTQVLVVDTVAYVAAGWGGMRTVSIKNPRNLRQLGVWTDGIPVEVQGLWVSGHFAYLGCGKDGIFCPINVSNPSSPTGPPYRITTRGIASDIVVAQDTAYVADGYGGHLTVDIRDGVEPAILDSIRMGDVCYDAILSGGNVYVGAGKVGVKIFDTAVLNPNSPLKRIPQAGQFDTQGEARGIKKIGSLMYVADGSAGLAILNVSNPVQPVRIGGYSAGGDTTYQVDVSGSYAVLASGGDGLRIVDISGSIFEAAASPVATHGRATDVQIVGNRAYVANSTGLHVYSLSALPASVSLVDSMPHPAGIHFDLRALEVSGDTVFAANGKYGLLLWKTSNDLILSRDIGGVCTDLSVREKTLYASDAVNGLRIFDASSAGELHEVGYYRHRGNALGIGLSPTDGRAVLADGASGLMTFNSFIQPKIVVTPSRLNFGPVPTDYTRSLQLMVRNTGTSLLNVTGIQTITNTKKNEFKFSETRFTVAAGDTHKITVRFEPNLLTYPFNVIGSTQIHSNDPVDSLTAITLQGQVTNLATQEPYTADDFTVGLWHFDEADGIGTVTDASGNGLHGLVYGDPVREDEDPNRLGYGRQIDFDKVNDWVRIPASPLMNFYNTPFTAELWFNMASKPAASYVLAKRGNDLTQQFELTLGSGDVGLIGRVWDSNGNTHTLTSGSMESLSVNQWYHAALCWDGDTLRLYLNSVLKGKTAVSGEIRFQATEPLAIGANSFGTSAFHGAIDEVRLSNISREAWEFHVTRSRLDVSLPVLNFGDVLVNQSRSVPFAVSNVGSEPLLITGVSSTNANVTVSPTQPFPLQAGHTDTLLARFAPVAEEILTESSVLNITSNDPTFPLYTLRLRGAGVVTLQAGAYRTDPLTIGLWHLDESAGTVVHDSSGSALDGTLSGSVFHELDVRKFDPGASLRFESQNGLVSVKPPAGARIAPTWGGMTAETWFNLRGLPLGKGTMLKRGSGAFFQFHLYIDSTATLVGQAANSAQRIFMVTSKSMGDLKIRQWYHAALVCGVDSVRLFVNGNRVDAVPFKGSMAGAQASAVMDTLSILAGSNWERTTQFYGYLDEMRLSSVARQSWEFNVNLARIEVSASRLQFGQVLLGKERTFQLWVKNPGIDALVVSSASTSAPATFQIDSTHFTVPAGGSQLIQVTFRPLASGRQAAQLVFRTNDPFWPVWSVSLEGDGLVERSFEPYASDSFTLALFHFDEKTTTAKVVWDSSSTGLKGTFGDGVAWSDSGRYGRAMQFSSGSVRIPPNAALNFTRGDFTVEFWFDMLRQVGAKAVLFKQDSTEAGTFEIALDTTQNAGVAARFKDGQGEMRLLKTGGMKNLHLQQWYHVALSYGTGKIRLYLNGIATDSLAFAGGFRTVRSTDIRLGTGFAGRIDEFRVSGIPRADWEFSVVPPVIAVNPTSLNFATVLVQEARIIPVWIRNQGDQDLSVTAGHGVSAAFNIPDSVKAFTLHRLQTRMIPVTYRPTRADFTDRDTLTLISNDPASRRIVVLLEGSSTEAKSKTEYASDSHTLVLYHLNSTMSDTAFDASGHARDGILNGDARWTTEGFFNGAVSLNGKTDFIRVPSGPAPFFDYARQSFTIECYFRTDTLSQTLFSSGFSDSSHILNYGLSIDSDGRLTVPYFGSGGARVNDGSWHHAAFAFNYLDASGTGRLYLDGNLVWSRALKTVPAVDPNRPLILGASEIHSAKIDSSDYTGYFYGMLDEVRISDIVRESWEFKLVDFGIKVEKTEPETLKVGEPLVMRISVPSSLRAVKAVFHYRAGGQTSYRSLDMEAANNSVYKVDLPAAAITLQGLEYYIEIQNATETLTYPGLDPVNNPFSRSVVTAGLEAATRFRIRQFQMFSVPLQLDTTNVRSVLEDDFGPYDPYQWRLFWWHREQYRYVAYDATDTTSIYFDFRPGRAYWLVSSTERTFDVGRGRTVSLDSMVSVPVDSGWNMIGNPFNFPVRWEDCSVSSDSVTTPYGYESENGIQPDQPTLEPWKGYWVYNWGAADAKLFVPPKANGMQKAARGRAGLVRSLAKGEWLIQLSAETKARRDFYNFAGVKNGARETFDAFDRPDPPAVEAGIALAFDHGDWKRHAGTYAADIRGAGERGHVWRFRVESRTPEEDVTLGWKFIQTLPEGWEGYLFDLAEGTSVKLADLPSKRYKTGKAPVDARTFKLVAGSREFIAAESEGIPLEPVAFRLFQNYPNPFNPETVIHYSIPKNGHAELVLYNALGQKVRTLIDADAKTGVHDAVWNGRDDSGRLLPSGVYIYRLKTPESAAVRKMILIR